MRHDAGLVVGCYTRLQVHRLHVSKQIRRAAAVEAVHDLFCRCWDLWRRRVVVAKNLRRCKRTLRQWRDKHRTVRAELRMSLGVATMPLVSPSALSGVSLRHIL
jgi:hypothetical protein